MTNWKTMLLVIGLALIAVVLLLTLLGMWDRVIWVVRRMMGAAE